jgi:SAM-dependent methyltransferase
LALAILKQAVRRVGNGLGLSRPASPLGREENAGWYDTLYGSSADYQCGYAESFYYFLWAVIADRIRRAGFRRVLEIGCGPGQLAAFLLEQGVTEYTGLDFSPAAIALARKHAPRGTFVVGDARSPEIHASAAHDVVICTEVLEHIEKDLLVVSNFSPGKRCLCSVPNFPYESHVRHFADARAVADRYGWLFRDLDVMTFPSPRSRTDLFFLLDGVRNDATAPPG